MARSGGRSEWTVNEGSGVRVDGKEWGEERMIISMYVACYIVDGHDISTKLSSIALPMQYVMQNDTRPALHD